MTRKNSQQGAALIIAVVVVTIVSGLVYAFLTYGISSSNEHFSAKDHLATLYIAEAGISHALSNLAAGGTGNLGTQNQKVPFNGGGYWVVAIPNGDGTTTLISNAVFGTHKRAIEVVVSKTSGSIFGYGVFSDRDYRIDANAYVDSYDSDTGSYASQISGSYHGQSFAKQNGSIGSNGKINLDSNAKVFGNANAVGGTTFATNAYVSGSSAPLSAPVPMPTVTVPPAPMMAPLNVGTGSSATVPPGTYHFPSMTTDANSSITIRGPATIVVDHFNTDSNSTIVIDSTNGPVEIYGTGWFRLDSNSTVSSVTKKPADLRINITTDNYTGYETSPTGNPALPVKIGSNASLYAAIVAPNAILRLDSNGGFYGAAIGKKISQDSNFGIHYDEALGRLGGGGKPTYQVKSWREVTPAP